jgi:hypothetical protein
VTEYKLLRTNGAPAKPFGGCRVKRSASHSVPRHHCGRVLLPLEQASDPSLSRFDAAVSALNEYEELRYPNSVLNKGKDLN